MKKITPVFLLFIFLFNTMGYYVIFKYEQYTIKSSIVSAINSDRIDQNKIVALSLDKNELQNVEWLEDGKEMLYNGHLYDVARTERTSNKTIYYCIDDRDEDSLFVKLDDHINTHVASTTSDKKESSKKLSDTIIKLYYSNENNISFSQSVSLLSNTAINNIYSSIHIEISSPPPELALA